MFVIIAASYLLACAEAGELPVSPRFTRNPAKPGVKLVTAATLQPLQAQLERWQNAPYLPSLLELMLAAKLVEPDGNGFWRPTAAAYSWLQLPPASACQLLMEGGLIGLPLSASFVADLLQSGVTLTPANRLILESLALFDLVETDGAKFFATPYSALLLKLLARYDPTSPGLDEKLQLNVSYQWQILLPGSLPEAGWLAWWPSEFCFVLAAPVTRQPLSFNPWVLFRLFSLCELLPAHPGYFLLRPTQPLLAATLERGISAKIITTIFAAGLAGRLPQTLGQTLAEWLATLNRFRVRTVTIIETASREDLRELLTDYKLRKSLGTVLSPRHVTIPPAEIGLLERKMARRGLYLHFDPNVLEPTRRASNSEIKLNRAQLQIVLAALLTQRRLNLEQGYPVVDLSGLIDYLAGWLSLREQREAAQVAAMTDEIASIPAEQTANLTYFAEDTDVTAALEMVITEESDLLIEYYPPDKPATRRWILPLQLYQHDDYWYLVSYCYLRQAERVFRLDRLILVAKRT